jgi:hypothetical protein
MHQAEVDVASPASDRAQHLAGLESLVELAAYSVRTLHLVEADRAEAQTCQVAVVHAWNFVAVCILLREMVAHQVDHLHETLDGRYCFSGLLHRRSSMLVARHGRCSGLGLQVDLRHGSADESGNNQNGLDNRHIETDTGRAAVLYHPRNRSERDVQILEMGSEVGHGQLGETLVDKSIEDASKLGKVDILADRSEKDPRVAIASNDHSTHLQVRLLGAVVHPQIRRICPPCHRRCHLPPLPALAFWTCSTSLSETFC